MEMKDAYYEEAYKSQEELPTKIRIDASTICQLHCPSCYMIREADKVKTGCGTGYLKFEDFKTFIDLNPHIKEIEFSNNGEIFLNPDFVKIIEYTHSKGLMQYARNGVNLNYLTDEQAEALVKNQFDQITISLDGASQDSYSKYRIGGNFDNVINNIKKIIHYRNIYKKQTPLLHWKYIVFGHNEKEIPKAKEMAKDLVDQISFKKSWNNDFPIQDEEFVKRETEITNINVFDSPIEKLIKFRKNPQEWFPCLYLWTSPQINWDGQLLGCCCNFSDRFENNVFNKNLKEILNSPKIIYAKNMIKGKAPANKNIPCYNCYIYNAMKKENLWLKYNRHFIKKRETIIGLLNEVKRRIPERRI